MSNITSKAFTVVGVSLHNGAYKVRYANSTKRAAVLERNGHTGIKLFEMPFPGTKEDAVDVLLGMLDGIAAEAITCIKLEALEMGFVL